VINDSLKKKRLRLSFRNFERQRPLPLKPILLEAIKLFGDDTIKEIKERVYDHITEYLDTQGYPSESVGTFKEANVNDLVLFILSAIVYKVRSKTGRDISIIREKEIVSVDGETGGEEEFVLMDLVCVDGLEGDRYVLVAESKRSSTGEAKRQCMLAMRDMWDHNTSGEVYGFVTTGEAWKMIKYDGASFIQTTELLALFNGMEEEKQEWINRYSFVVECMLVALASGGRIVKDVVRMT